MKRTHVLFVAATLWAASAASGARAQDVAEPLWTAWVSVSGDTAINDDRPVSDNTLGGTVGLERAIGFGGIGVSFGGATRDVELDRTSEVVSADSVFIGAYGYVPVDLFDVSVWVDYANERSDRSVQTQGGGERGVQFDSDFVSVGGDVSRVYGGRTRVIPSLSLGWSTGETSADFSASGIVLDGVSVTQNSNGLVGTVGASVERDISERVTAYAAGSLIGAQSELSAWNRSGGGSNRRAGVTTSGEDDGALWGYVGAGLSSQFGEVTASIDISSSVGAETDFLSSAVTVSRSF